MPQQRVASTGTGTSMTPTVTRTRRRRRGRTTTKSSMISGIKFTTDGHHDFGSFLAQTLDQYRTRLTGQDLALTINLAREAWDNAVGS